MSYDEQGNKIKSSGPDGFMVIDFSKFHDTWVNVGDANVEEVEVSHDSEWDDAIRNLPTSEEAPSIPKEWRDKAFETDVQRAIRQMDVVDEARQLREMRDKPAFVEPQVFTLADLLARPRNPTQYSIDQLWPSGGNVLFAAPAKFGKSTVMMNLLRSLADGTAFLGHFEVRQVPDGETILLIDMEMSEDRVIGEIMDQDIQRENPPIQVALMRGSARDFDIADPETRAYWIARCKAANVKTLIIDPIAPLLGYLNVEENDNTAVNRFFQQLDEFKKDAGIRDMLLTHHCGHTAGFRPRGASRFNDWPDALWVCSIEGDITDPQHKRKFFARGRDVGENFQGAGNLDRDLNNKKVLIFDVQSASVSQAAAARRGVVENIIFTHKGKDKTYLLPLINAQIPNDPMTIRQLEDMLRDLVAEGSLHGHQQSLRGAPIWYWIPTDCTCANP